MRSVTVDAMSALPVDSPVVELAGGVRFAHGVEFAAVEGFRPLVLDLYLPPGATRPTPAVVYLHGGGWTVGTRRRFGRAFKGWSPTPMELVARSGIAIVSVDYRLTGEAPFPAAVHDAKAAVRWVRANAAALGVDPHRIVAWGESAGGHLAAMVGLTAGRPELEGSALGNADVDSSVCGVVAWYPPTDLVHAGAQRRPDATSDPDAPDSWEARFVGAPLPSAPDAARAASPIAYVHAGAPPFHLHHGDGDRVVPHEQSASLAAALRAAGVPVELVTVPGADHFWTGAPSLEAIFDASLAFVRRITA